MAAGTITSAKVEIEWVSGSGTFVDETANVVWTAGIQIRPGGARGGEFDDAQPGTMQVSFYNEDGRYTPDNPMSAVYPNVVKGKRIRFSVVRAATTYWRFRGIISTPAAAQLDTGQAVAVFTAIDGLGQMAQRVLAAEWVEAWAFRALTQTADCFPMDDDPAATSLHNAVGTGTARIVPAASGAGSSQLGSVSQGILLPGAVALTADGTGVGPVVAVDFGRTVGGGVITFAVSTSAMCTATSGDLILAEGLNAAGFPVWSVRLTWNAGHTDLDIFDEVSPGYLQWIASIDGDDQYKAISVFDNGSGTTWFVNNANGVVAAPRNDQVRYLVLGGRVGNWGLLGKQKFCPASISVAGVAAASTSTSDRMDHARPLALQTSTVRADELIVQYSGLAKTISGAVIPQVTRTDTTGRNALDCLTQLAGTVGGNVFHDYTNDTITLVMSDVAKPITSSVTVTMEADDDASTPMQWQGPADTKPTRVTVSCAFGSKTAIDVFSESVLHLRSDESYASCAGSSSVAGSIAGARLNRSTAARIPQVAVDLVTAANDLYAAVLTLDPGNRITLTALPSDKLGRTIWPAYALGWSETWTQWSAVFVFDLAAADAPPELRLDDAVYGRVALGDGAATVTSGTAVGSTGTGTIVVTTAGGILAFSNTAGSYPLNLNWAGECVTVTSAPGSTASPQTLTLTARGVNGTVARAHAAGDPIDVWLAATLAAI